MSSPPETFQISLEQAETYESTFVPAIFSDWAPPLVDAAGVRPGQRVLDVACGTGILARTAAALVGPTGEVVGVDLNLNMLSVAERLRPDLEWRLGDAAALPFADGAFDVVLCQSALMFFPDATGALREMARVCTPRGTVGVQVYSSLAAQPAYRPWIEMVARYAGPEAITVLGTYWVHGDLEVLRERFASAGLEIMNIVTRVGTARWGSVEEMVRTEVTSTPLVEAISDEVYQRILKDSRDVLGRFQAGTHVEVPIEGHLVIAQRR